jgi:hypothetical protein
VTGDPGPQACREVRVRLIGEPADLEAVAGVLDASPVAEVVTRSGHKPNRYDPGERMYVVVRLGEEAST